MKKLKTNQTRARLRYVKNQFARLQFFLEVVSDPNVNTST